MNPSDGSLTPDEIPRQLEALIAYPREDLDRELKGWLDMHDGEQAASLLKAVLALANHGGGFVLIGFSEQLGTWVPDEAQRPTDLKAYDQDRINGLVTNYAEPAFHCEVHHVPHPQTSAVHPVVVVPPGRVPIRAKRDSPERKQVRLDSYYVRLPGPKSETPRTGADWDRLLRRCTLNDRDALLDDIRRLLGAGPLALVPAPLSTIDQIDAWAESSLERWAQLIAQRAVGDVYKHGTATYAYLIQGTIEKPSQAELIRLLEQAKGPETGWPMWLVLRGDRSGDPHTHQGTVEALLAGDTVFNDPSHSDYWRADPDGRFFLLRGFEEDDERENRPPGSAFDFLLPVWRCGEALLHASRVAVALDVPDATITFRAGWTGLHGRALRSLWDRRFMDGSRRAREDSVVSHVEVPADSISPNLAEILQQLLAPLYAVFDFFQMPASVVEEELARFRAPRWGTGA
jgi:hypothetical protein